MSTPDRIQHQRTEQAHAEAQALAHRLDGNLPAAQRADAAAAERGEKIAALRTHARFVCTLCGVTQPADSEHLSGFAPNPPDPESRAIYCRACVDRARFAHIDAMDAELASRAGSRTDREHPTTCKCQGTNLCHVTVSAGDNVVSVPTEDPCEDWDGEDEDAAYDRGAESRYFQTGRWTRD